MLSPGPNVAPVRVGRCRVTCWARPSSRLVTGARLASDCWPRLVSDRGQLSGPGLHTPPCPPPPHVPPGGVRGSGSMSGLRPCRHFHASAPGVCSRRGRGMDSFPWLSESGRAGSCPVLPGVNQPRAESGRSCCPPNLGFCSRKTHAHHCHVASPGGRQLAPRQPVGAGETAGRPRPTATKRR